MAYNFRVLNTVSVSKSVSIPIIVRSGPVTVGETPTRGQFVRRDSEAPYPYYNRDVKELLVRLRDIGSALNRDTNVGSRLHRQVEWVAERYGPFRDAHPDEECYDFWEYARLGLEVHAHLDTLGFLQDMDFDELGGYLRDNDGNFKRLWADDARLRQTPETGRSFKLPRAALNPGGPQSDPHKVVIQLPVTAPPGSHPDGGEIEITIGPWPGPWTFLYRWAHDQNDAASYRRKVADNLLSGFGARFTARFHPSLGFVIFGDVRLLAHHLIADTWLGGHGKVIKKCEGCGRYFVATRPNQRSCPGGRCRQRKHAKKAGAHPRQ